MSRNLKLIIFILVIVVGGFLMYASFKNEDTQKDDNTNFEVTETTDSDGMVYTNDEFNYQVTFPAGWAKQVDDGDYVSFLGPVAQEQEVVTELLQGMKIEIWITAMSGVTLDEAVEAELEIYSQDEILERTDIAVDGREAIKVKTYLLGYTIVTYILEDNILYKFIGYVGDEQENAKYVAKYSSILSEFEFI